MLYQPLKLVVSIRHEFSITCETPMLLHVV